MKTRNERTADKIRFICQSVRLNCGYKLERENYIRRTEFAEALVEAMCEEHGIKSKTVELILFGL